MHPRQGLLALILATLGAAPSHAAPPTGAGPPTDAAAADNAFGFRLLNAVQKATPTDNVVLSPVSAALALSMVLNGARDQTKSQMQEALSLGERDLDAVNGANAQLIKLLRTPTRDVTLSVANSLWVNRGRVTLLPDYQARMQASYDAEISALDFADPGATGRINGWASEQTHGRISKLIDQLNAADLSLLLDAVYFKGQWTHKFDKAQTRPRDFTLAGGSVKQTPRMAQSGRFEYFETGELQAIRLPFGDGDLAMEVLLPARSSSLAALEANLTSDHWKDWQARYASRPGRIELPRFELKAAYSLNAPLKALGMTRVFQAQGSQLTGMLAPAGRGDVGRFFISLVRQSVFWQVDEEGSEAAAVTAIGIRAAAVMRQPPPFEMIVDRPFFCAIEDRRSGALLFVGAIFDPSP
jgi:serine protease inhibitor